MCLSGEHYRPVVFAVATLSHSVALVAWCNFCSSWFGIAPALVAECFFLLSFADMSSGLRTKVFEGYIMPLVQRWIADNPLRWHDQTLDFHRWWQIIMGYSLADVSTRETEPDYRIVLEAGVRRVLKHSGFRSRCLDFTTYLWTSQDHVSTKSNIETVA